MASQAKCPDRLDRLAMLTVDESDRGTRCERSAHSIGPLAPRRQRQGASMDASASVARPSKGDRPNRHQCRGLMSIILVENLPARTPGVPGPEVAAASVRITRWSSKTKPESARYSTLPPILQGRNLYATATSGVSTYYGPDSTAPTSSGFVGLLITVSTIH